MPPELDNTIDEAAEISAVEPSADVAAVSSTADVTASSSDATDVTDSDGALSIVRDVVDKARPKDVAAVSSTEGAEGGLKPGEAPPSDEDVADVKRYGELAKHPRVRELLGKNREYKSRVSELEPDATRYQNVQRFIDEQGLGGEEARDLLVIGGLIKTNPAEAWKRMQPVVQKVLIAAGEVLPDELKQMVASGEMTREAALEVSRTRAQLQSVEARTQFDQQRAQARQQSEIVNAVQGAVSSWEAERRTRDPNFDAKLSALQREIAFLQMSEGRPNTPEGVRKQLQTAYDAVSAAVVVPVARQRPAVRPVTGGQVSGSVRPEINSTHDAVAAVLARRAG